MQTARRLEATAAGVWALGDVNGGPQFTPVSLDDWRIVAAILAGGDRSTTERIVPYPLFIDPEVGRVEMAEALARRRGHRVRVARLPADEVPRAMTSGETRGYLKAVGDADSDRILGASILAAAGGGPFEIETLTLACEQGRLIVVHIVRHRSLEDSSGASSVIVRLRLHGFDNHASPPGSTLAARRSYVPV